MHEGVYEAMLPLLQQRQKKWGVKWKHPNRWMCHKKVVAKALTIYHWQQNFAFSWEGLQRLWCRARVAKSSQSVKEMDFKLMPHTQLQHTCCTSYNIFYPIASTFLGKIFILLVTPKLQFVTLRSLNFLHNSNTLHISEHICPNYVIFIYTASTYSVNSNMWICSKIYVYNLYCSSKHFSALQKIKYIL